MNTQNKQQKKSLKKKVVSLVKKEVAKTPLARHPGATIGRALEKYAKVPMAGKIGSAIGKLAGTGDYVLSPNITTAGKLHGRKRGTRVVHREYIGDVTASSTAGAFTNTSYPINPGMATTFPWLCTIAQQFDQWRPIAMAVEFISTSSFYSGTSALGTICIAADYDVSDAPYATKIEMNNSENAVSGACAENLLYGLECKRSEVAQNLYYTRSTAVTQDLRFYDLANIEVATYGCTASQVCGELWVTYEVEFYKEQVYGGLAGKGILEMQFQAVSGVSGSNCFGSSQTLAASNNIVVTFGTNSITFPDTLKGSTFQILFYLLGTSTALTSSSVSYSSSCKAGPLTLNQASGLMTGGTSPLQLVSCTVTLTGNVIGVPMTVTWPNFTAPTSPSCVGFITQINPNVTF